MNPTEPDHDLSEFNRLRELRSLEKLTAAKKEVDEALYELSGSQDGRDSECAADAIVNLIRVIMAERS